MPPSGGTLDAGAGAGQQDRAIAAGDHAAGRLLDDEKPAERRDLDGHANSLRIKLGDRPMRPRAGVVHDHIGNADACVRFFEKVRHRRGVDGVDGEPFSADFFRQRRQFVDIASSHTHLETSRCKAARD